MGDFNSITSPDEKIYGAEVTGDQRHARVSHWDWLIWHLMVVFIHGQTIKFGAN